MKPNFALNLGHDGIALLHRGKHGWTLIGSVSLDDPNFAAGLEMLRKTAVSLEAGGMTAKVLIPDSQILYTEIEISDISGVTPVAEISQRLDGLTPYPASELVFDWRPIAPGRVRLAVIARETLAEAEAFAREYRFNLVGFAAAPRAADFPGEPFFGPAASATALLAETGPVEPDAEALDLAVLLRPAEATADALAEATSAEAPEARRAATLVQAGDQASETESAPLDRSPEAGTEEDAAAEDQAEDRIAGPTPVAALLSAAAASRSAPSSPATPDVSVAPAPPPSSVPSPTPEMAPQVTLETALQNASASANTGATVLSLHPGPAESKTGGPAGEGPSGPDGPPGASAETLDSAAPAESEIEADAAAELRRMPTFASRRSSNAAAPRVRIEPSLTSGPQRPSERVSTRLPLEDRPTPRLIDLGAAATAKDTEVGLADPALPVDAPQAEAAAPVADAAAAPARSAPPVVALSEDPPVLRRLPPAPPRLKPAPGAPSRRAPVINFGPKSQTSAAADDPLPEMPGAAGSAAAGQRGPGDELSVFGAQRIPATRRRSPATVVVLTLLLLAGLAGLALWSTFWTDSGDDPVASVALVPDGARLPDSPIPAAAAPDPLPPQPVLPAADLALAEPELPDDPAAADLALAAPELPEDPAAADLAGRPLDPAADLPEPDTDFAALSPEAEAEAEAEAEFGAGEIDDEALADGEPDALLNPVPEDDGLALDETPLDVNLTDEVLTAEAALDAPAEEAELAALDPAPAPVPDTPALPEDPVTELVATDAGAAERIAAQLLNELTPEVAETRYAASGIWVLPPVPPAEPGFDSVDNLYVAAIDNQIEGEDAVALPVPQRDSGLLTQLPPPPAGTTFDFDERGLVRATPEGALNPDGILIFAGRPALVPAPRPGSADAVGAGAPAAAPVDAAAPGLEGAPAEGAEPPVPSIRPKPRPEDLTELNEKATLGGRTRVELAGLRPRERPQVIEKLALANQVPDAAAVDAVAAAADAAVAQVALELAPATRLAVQVSRLPKAKPGNIAAIAAAAQVAPKPIPVTPEPAAKSGGNAKVDEDDGEPVLAASAVMPKLPTKAGVAKTATVSNAINLSKINLIGVYGSSASRRALVRMPNGKYVKVQVGDRLDGGKVAAIGESELIYVKGNKQHRLQMPSKT